MKAIRYISIGLLVLLLAFILFAWYLITFPQGHLIPCNKDRGWGDFLHTSEIGIIDNVYPFGLLDITGEEVLTIKLDGEEIIDIKSKDTIKKLRGLSFYCTGTDWATPSEYIEIQRNGETVYSTSLIQGGFQSSEYGYIRPYNPIRYALIIKDILENRE